MFTSIDSSVIIYVVAQAQPNYPLIIRCKGTTNIWTTQGFNGKNIVYLYFSEKSLLFAQLCERSFEGPL